MFEGDKVVLSCNVTNDPDAMANSLRVIWHDPEGVQLKTVTNDGILAYNKTDPITGLIQSALVYDSANRSRSGMYTCQAYNDPESYSEESTTLTVECKLLPIQICVHAKAQLQKSWWRVAAHVAVDLQC